MTSPLKTVTNIEEAKAIDNEAMFLFLATAFAQMYYDGVKKKTKDVEKLLLKLAKRSRPFSARLKTCLFTAQCLFEQAEDNLKNRPKQKFVRPIVLDENNELGIHGLLFSVSIILEHRNLDNRKLILPYKEAQAIYNNFTDKNDICYNALLVAKEFTELVKGLK